MSAAVPFGSSTIRQQAIIHLAFKIINIRHTDTSRLQISEDQIVAAFIQVADPAN